MAQDDSDRQAEAPADHGRTDPQPRHWTREPWWVIPLAGAVAALLPLLKYRRFQRACLGSASSRP